MARGALACKFVHCGKPAKSSFPQWSRWKLPRSPSPAPSSTAPSSPGPSSTAPPLLPRRRPLGAPRDPRRPPTRRPRRSPPFSAAPLATSISTSGRLPTAGSAVFLNRPLVTAPPRASRLRRSVATAGSAAAASPPRRASLLLHSPPPQPSTAATRPATSRPPSSTLGPRAAAHRSPEASPPRRRPVPKPARPPRRLHDHEPLHAAVGASSSLLPVFVFDPRDFGKSPSGFDRTGPYRANFLLDSVADLRRSLRARGGDLVVRVGRPEVVIPELARAAGVEAVYAHGEVSRDECSAEEKVSKAIEKEGVEVKYFWGSTLYHLDDLPFRLEDMPSNYGGFREAVKGLEVRKVLDAPEEVKCVPMKNVLEPGEIPTLGELGLSAPPAMAQDSKSAVGSTLIGGEAEALERLKKFAVG